MPSIKDITNVWNNVKEVDLRPLREAALQPVEIALIGAPGVGRRTLAAQMRRDPARPALRTQTPLVITNLEDASQAEQAQLMILVIDSTQPDLRREQNLARQLTNSGKKVLVFCNKVDALPEGQVIEPPQAWAVRQVVYGSANRSASLLRGFVPAVLELLPEQHLALGRLFPLFRLPIARQLVSDTCFSNAAYALSTGIAEIIPIFDLPLNITDMIVLTKAQAFLAYKLGLLLGFSTNWHDYVAEFGSVIGGGFLWRQLARQLVGLIPVAGIIPKVAISYSGTYIIGQSILQWYLTGKHLSRQQVKEIYTRAFVHGKAYAKQLIGKIPRSGLKQHLPAELQISPEPGAAQPNISTTRSLRIKLPRFNRDFLSRINLRKNRTLQSAPAIKICGECGKPNAKDAVFCQYCGKPLD